MRLLLRLPLKSAFACVFVAFLIILLDPNLSGVRLYAVFLLFVPMSAFIFFFMLFASFPVARYILTRIGWQMWESPCGPLAKAIAISTFCFLKVVQWQSCL